MTVFMFGLLSQAKALRLSDEAPFRPQGVERVAQAWTQGRGTRQDFCGEFEGEGQPA